MSDPIGVHVYWRPGCPYCMVLRRGLHTAGLPTRETNIWSNPDAAAFVRSVAGGNETVPTVVIGDRAMVNPSARQVLKAVECVAPHLLTARFRRFGLRGVGYALLAAALWVLLSLAQPDTTFHLVPAVTTAAWAVVERFACLAPLTRTRATVTVAGGAAITLAATALLHALDQLGGPSLIGGAAATETLVVLAATAVAAWFGVSLGGRSASARRPRR